MEKNIKTFPLLNIMLYAKGHYNRDGNIWDNLAKCLEADQYGPYEDPYNERNTLTELIVAKIRPFLKEYMINDLLSHCSPYGCWKVGYYTTDAPWKPMKDAEVREPYDYWEAVVRAHLSCIVSMSKEDLGIDEWPEPQISELLKVKETH